MEERLKNFIDALFEGAPQTRQTAELKEEMFQNLRDKYNDLIQEGKSEEAAFNIAVASIGDVSELILSLNTRQSSSVEKAQEEIHKKRSAIFVTVAVMLYILCVVPVMLIPDIPGVILMFLLIAAATGLLIYHSMTKSKYRKNGDSVVEDFKEWNSINSDRRQVFKALSSALWTLTVAVYLIVSFMTMAWHITWIIFLIAALLEGVLKAIVSLRK